MMSYQDSIFKDIDKLIENNTPVSNGLSPFVFYFTDS